MELLKNIKKSLNFQDRYSEMEGAGDGFDRSELQRLKKIQKGGGRVDQDRLDYLETIGNERTRAIGTGVATVGGVVAGAYTGNPALIKASLGMGAQYLSGEVGELGGPNDGVGQQLGMEDALRAASPFLSGIGGGTKTQVAPGEEAPGLMGSLGADRIQSPYSGGNTGGLMFKQGGKLRYNPRKYDYIKGNTFGLK